MRDRHCRHYIYNIATVYIYIGDIRSGAFTERDGGPSEEKFTTSIARGNRHVKVTHEAI